jgi:hypothetical protein
MSHFVCTGECGGVSESPKSCEGENCTKKGNPMVECNCGSDDHGQVSGGEVEDGTEGSEES